MLGGGKWWVVTHEIIMSSPGTGGTLVHGPSGLKSHILFIKRSNTNTIHLAPQTNLVLIFLVQEEREGTVKLGIGPSKFLILLVFATNYIRSKEFMQIGLIINVSRYHEITHLYSERSMISVETSHFPRQHQHPAEFHDENILQNRMKL